MSTKIRNLALAAVVLVFAGISAAAWAAQGGWMIWGSIGSAGGPSQSESFALMGSLGQMSASGEASSANYGVRAGFWEGASAGIPAPTPTATAPPQWTPTYLPLTLHQ